VFNETMRRREYRLGKRADAASATRRRIVEATVTLHDEQGITGTSVREVAARAGVAPGTILHHFPRMDDLIQACGELSEAMAPMPTEEIFVPGMDRASRVRTLILELFTWWERLGTSGWNHLQVDRTAVARVNAWLIEVAARHRRLVGVALGPAGARQVDVVTAMTVQGVWSSMQASGIDTRDAAAQVSRLVNRSLEAVQ
jgi:AcrR family transcriptional regulator